MSSHKRIVLNTFGSFGDVHPYMALAMELQARGHKPVIATSPLYRPKIEGAGLSFALGCDIRICSDNSKFALPAAKLGLGYGLPGIKRFVDTVGPSFTKEFFFTARQFDAAEALAMGLAHERNPRLVLKGVAGSTEGLQVRQLVVRPVRFDVMGDKTPCTATTNANVSISIEHGLSDTSPTRVIDTRVPRPLRR